MLVTIVIDMGESEVADCSMKYTASERMSNSPRRPFVENHVTLYLSGLFLITCKRSVALLLAEISTSGFKGNVDIADGSEDDDEEEGDVVISANTFNARIHFGESFGTGSRISFGRLG